MRYQIHEGDNLEWLRAQPDNSIDSVCTDPPYGLGKEPNALEMLQAWIDHDYLEVAGAGFMGRKWDAFVPQPIFWKEVYRVLKPGGHVMSFAGTRTYDWMVMAIRLAGFEIRDQLIWMYGGGFPKSHNVGKGIDKQAGAEREVIGTRKHAPKGKTSAYGEFVGDSDQTAPATPEAQEWDGWGTALSPSHEPIVLARKPLEKGLTIAQNVLKWGTGALNIDGCRIEHSTVDGGSLATNPHLRSSINGGNGGHIISTEKDRRVVVPNMQGRWPSNLLLANVPDVIGLFPENAKSGGDGTATPRNKENNSSYTIGKIRSTTSHESIGSASRYFFRADMLPIEQEEQLSIEQKAIYCSKPSQYERDLGADPADEKHCTVKPVAVMHHLATLITPPEGICLDPFCGSGTTGIGAMLAGPSIRFIGLEMQEAQCNRSLNRIKHWKRYRQFIEAKATDTPAKKAATSAKAVQGSLF